MWGVSNISRPRADAANYVPQAEQDAERANWRMDAPLRGKEHDCSGCR